MRNRTASLWSSPFSLAIILPDTLRKFWKHLAALITNSKISYELRWREVGSACNGGREGPDGLMGPNASIVWLAIDHKEFWHPTSKTQLNTSINLNQTFLSEDFTDFTSTCRYSNKVASTSSSFIGKWGYQCKLDDSAEVTKTYPCLEDFLIFLQTCDFGLLETGISDIRNSDTGKWLSQISVSSIIFSDLKITRKKISVHGNVD